MQEGRRAEFEKVVIFPGPEMRERKKQDKEKDVEPVAEVIQIENEKEIVMENVNLSDLNDEIELNIGSKESMDVGDIAETNCDEGIDYINDECSGQFVDYSVEKMGEDPGEYVEHCQPSSGTGRSVAKSVHWSS